MTTVYRPGSIHDKAFNDECTVQIVSVTCGVSATGPRAAIPGDATRVSAAAGRGHRRRPSLALRDPHDVAVESDCAVWVKAEQQRRSLGPSALRRRSPPELRLCRGPRATQLSSSRGAGDPHSGQLQTSERAPTGAAAGEGDASFGAALTPGYWPVFADKFQTAAIDTGRCGEVGDIGASSLGRRRHGSGESGLSLRQDGRRHERSELKVTGHTNTQRTFCESWALVCLAAVGENCNSN